MPHWPKLFGVKPLNYSLDRIKDFLNRLNNPEKIIPPVIHISGTNGKGSTLAFIRYIMQSAGYKVHAYTSPHLINFNERIVIAGNNINDNELYNLLEECREIVRGQPITLFEASTITAFLAFSRHKADVTLVEVGMGGRLDATNVINNPFLTIITSISHDHTEYLGPTLEIIAGEKAGIMKPDIPCVIATQKKSVMNILEHYSVMSKSPIYRGDYEWSCKKKHDKIIFQSSVQTIELPLPALIGDHQITNAGNAIAACSILSGKYGFNIREEDIAVGLRNTRWPARLEHIQKGRLSSMLPKNWNLFLDGAHNSDGAKVLAEWIQDNFANGVYVIFGTTRNKNIDEFLYYLQPYTKLLCAVCVKSELHAVNTNLIKEKANNINIPSVTCESIEDAILNHIFKCTDEKIKTILICGSLFLSRDLAILNNS